MRAAQKDAANPGADLEEMQSTLYLIEAGDAEYRLGKLHLALKRYVAVDKVRLISWMCAVAQLPSCRYSTRWKTINMISTVIHCANSTSTSISSAVF